MKVKTIKTLQKREVECYCVDLTLDLAIYFYLIFGICGSIISWQKTKN